MEWLQEENALTAEFGFKNFVDAWAFLTKVAILAEKQNHHPEIWNVYNKVKLRLSTHDAGNTVTEKDYALAKAISGLVM